jgi:hypothetical protein
LPVGFSTPRSIRPNPAVHKIATHIARFFADEIPFPQPMRGAAQSLDGFKPSRSQSARWRIKESRLRNRRFLKLNELAVAGRFFNSPFDPPESGHAQNRNSHCPFCADEIPFPQPMRGGAQSVLTALSRQDLRARDGASRKSRLRNRRILKLNELAVAGRFFNPRSIRPNPAVHKIATHVARFSADEIPFPQPMRDGAQSLDGFKPSRSQSVELALFF